MKIVRNELPYSLHTNAENTIKKLYLILENAFYYKLANFEIDDGIIHLTIGKLIAFNNMITCGSFLMLRQKQMLCWVQETKQFKWIMDVRCMRYHLQMLLYVFNGRRITAEEFRENFMQIRPFQTANKTTVDVLLLGLKDNKKRKNMRWITCKSKILHKT